MKNQTISVVNTETNPNLSNIEQMKTYAKQQGADSFVDHNGDLWILNSNGEFKKKEITSQYLSYAQSAIAEIMELKRTNTPKSRGSNFTPKKKRRK